MINKQIHETAEKSNDRERLLAETSGIERLLNAYLRETGVFDPTLPMDDPDRKCLPVFVLDDLGKQGTPMRLTLTSTGVVVFGALTNFSVFGHHHYGRSFWVHHMNSENFTLVDTCKQIAHLLVNELAASATTALPKKNLKESLLFQIENSIEKTMIYAKRSYIDRRSLWSMDGEERFYTAEQSLVYGHPFHPAPKSSQGFSTEDLMKYAPEMRASFLLYYFAASPEIVRESFLQTDKSDEAWFSQKVMTAAKQRLGLANQQYRLIPCHPWQAEHVKQWPEVQKLLRTGLLIDLGPLGEQVYPTSSVRTVWDPKHAYFFKLPLNLRITNFIRVNPLDQLERTMDASRVLAFLTKQLPFSAFTILHEAGFRTLAPDSATEEQRQRLAESFGVILRENPTTTAIKKEVPLVIASLLEQPPYASEPPLIEAMRIAARQSFECNANTFLEKWLKQYVEISLLPLLWLFVEHGVSMEAHVQNSMVALQDGWPVHFYVRDLEGISIGRARAQAQAMFDDRLTEESPVLYADDEAWNRFKYYVVVNHFGHLIHTLAYYWACDEQALWKVAAEAVQSSSLLQKSVNRSYLDDLLENRGLPAKANFISSFQQRGESPLYVTIPNPLAAFRGKE